MAMTIRIIMAVIHFFMGSIFNHAKVNIKFIFILSVFFISCNHKNTSAENKTLFQLIPSSGTGITFNNSVKDTKDLNIFNFRNFYNGAGVAIGDVNNDGLADIFFTANQGKNKLYINKGNWKFQDETEAAGLR